ncbi:MAG: DUF86 domain-containing protein [Anaerolineae bacterium]|nr:DUF86 domain-containing protein [Anaerolineae bacterium]
MLDAMEKAELAISGVDYDRFIEDFMINFVVVRALEIVGEATKRLPMEFRERYPSIPWKEMAGMRDRIIHGYDKVNLDIVWQVVQKNIPKVKPHLHQILEDYEGPAGNEAAPEL